MSKIEQQREYVETLRKMYLKVFRVCGANSKPELALCETYKAQLLILREMEADNEHWLDED